ncbi:YHYH domain-containing protein [Paenibacillus alkalitolerans]|uniref:YHYH domain-containing protein n=1 Tax=Paenibacillus alkalitolerans TaxID=2799335 RepID=UPI002D80B736|nr:YHYH domain-containing protein [Paenibacillus alkalitolerans]
MRILLFVVIFLYFVPSAAAHPGRQNPDGGHVCRTNCPDWGLDYGEYHFHSYFNDGKSNRAEPQSSSWSIPSWLIWGIIIFAILIYWVYKSNSNAVYSRGPRNVINVPPQYIPPTEPIIYPPDEEVELTGMLTRTTYRKTPFFVAKFMDDGGNFHTIVGRYPGRLMTNKRYSIHGTNTYDRRYGQQIKVKSIERI